MTYQDFSSIEHRLDNLSKLRFTRQYAALRHHIFDDEMPVDLRGFLRSYIPCIERNIAIDLGIELSTLTGWLVDLGNEMTGTKSAQDRAESAEG